MDKKKSNARVVSFPIDQYDRKYLDTLKVEELKRRLALKVNHKFAHH